MVVCLGIYIYINLFLIWFSWWHESRTISLHLMRKLHAAEIWFYSRILIIPWTERIKKKRESFKNDDNKKNTYTPSQEKTIEITWSHNKNLENLNLRERIPSTGHRGGHRVIYVTSLCRWTAERRTTAWVEKLITEIGFGELWSPMCLKNAAHRIRYVVNAWNEFIYSSRFISL